MNETFKERLQARFNDEVTITTNEKAAFCSYRGHCVIYPIVTSSNYSDDTIDNVASILSQTLGKEYFLK